MRRKNKKLILVACKLSFNGRTNDQIAEELNINVGAVSRWRKDVLWHEFEQELIEAEKQSLLEARPATLSEG